VAETPWKESCALLLEAEVLALEVEALGCESEALGFFLLLVVGALGGSILEPPTSGKLEGALVRYIDAYGPSPDARAGAAVGVGS
jgi:hypothetical protein